MLGITCCKSCIAPKRHTGCHVSCPEYRQEKESNDKLNAEIRKANQIRHGLDSQRIIAFKRIKKEGRWHS